MHCFFRSIFFFASSPHINVHTQHTHMEAVQRSKLAASSLSVFVVLVLLPHLLLPDPSRLSSREQAQGESCFFYYAVASHVKRSSANNGLYSSSSKSWEARFHALCNLLVKKKKENQRVSAAAGGREREGGVGGGGGIVLYNFHLTNTLNNGPCAYVCINYL